MLFCRLLVGVLLLSASSFAHAQIHDGETVVFLGDSITQQGAGPTGYVTLVRQALDARRADSNIKIIGAGIGGHKVPNLEERLDRDVLVHKPNVVVIYIGINDVWHSLRDAGTPLERYESGLQNLITRCHDAGARVILCTPSVIGEKHDGTNQLDDMLEEYARVSRKVAAAANVTLLDLRKAFLQHLRYYNVANAAEGILTGDGVHLLPAGDRFVAAKMLQALGENSTPQRLLRHHVYFKFNDSVTAGQIDEINQAFANLKHDITTIVDFECGVNNSPEGLNDGFTHAYTVSFATAEDRDAYLPHPAHKAFVKLLDGKLAGVFVVDYWSVE